MNIKAKFSKLMDPKAKILNVPNLLSLLRVLLVPVFFATLIFMRNKGTVGVVIPAIIYALTAITDALDGKIARKYGLVTDFGKFIDPLADKFMVLGSMIAILAKYCLTIRLVSNYTADITFTILLAWLFLIILFRELAVTSMRLVVAGKHVKVDLSANIMGKLKTVSQMVGTVVFIVEPSFRGFTENHALSYICMAIMAVTTVWSGINYFLGYLPYIAEKNEAPDPDTVPDESTEADESDEDVDASPKDDEVAERKRMFDLVVEEISKDPNAKDEEEAMEDKKSDEL